MSHSQKLACFVHVYTVSVSTFSALSCSIQLISVELVQYKACRRSSECGDKTPLLAFLGFNSGERAGLAVPADGKQDGDAAAADRCK